MRTLLSLVVLFTGCAAPAGPADRDAAPRDAGSADADGATFQPDGAADVDAGMISLQFGHGLESFQPWAVGEELVVVAGPQGGYHTEHVAQTTGATKTQLHLALIWAELWRDDVVLARAGWEFYGDQWREQGDGATTYLPPLVFDALPQPGEAELRGSLELTDGRTATYTIEITLSDVTL